MKGSSNTCEWYPALVAVAIVSTNPLPESTVIRFEDCQIRIDCMLSWQLNKGGITTHSSLTNVSFAFREIISEEGI